MKWFTVYHNDAVLPMRDSWQGDASVLGEPDEIAGSIRIWKFDGIRLVESDSCLTVAASSDIIRK